MNNFREKVAYRVSLYLQLTVWIIIGLYLFIKPLVVFFDIDYYVIKDGLLVLPYMVLGFILGSIWIWIIQFIIIFLRIFSTSVKKGWWDILLTILWAIVIWVISYSISGSGDILKIVILDALILVPLSVTIYYLFIDNQNIRLEEETPSGDLVPLFVTVILILLILVLPAAITVKHRLKVWDAQKNGIYR